MFTLGPIEIAFFLGLVLLLFGPDKIPQLARSIGKATQEYQKALKEVTNSGNTLMSDIKGEGDSTGLTTNTSKSSPPSQSSSEQIIDKEKQIKQQAELLGISTAGKTIDQIVDEILSKSS